MSFDRLDYVMAIAEEQNMTKAAARLFISQPALTASINKLEEELGVKLFDRQRPPIKLTPAGVLYMKEMSRIHQLQFNLKAQLSSFARKKPQFTIGIGKGRSQFWLPILLPILQESHPEIQIIVKTETMIPWKTPFIRVQSILPLAPSTFRSPMPILWRSLYQRKTLSILFPVN